MQARSATTPLVVSSEDSYPHGGMSEIQHK
jgi:hypothetical protein